jgi:hypothetical protein
MGRNIVRYGARGSTIPIRKTIRPYFPILSIHFRPFEVVESAHVRGGQTGTPDQVVVALGQPERIVNLGAKQIYVYNDLKVTLVDGKVPDIH